jgi:hypothetical protein
MTYVGLVTLFEPPPVFRIVKLFCLVTLLPWLPSWTFDVAKDLVLANLPALLLRESDLIIVVEVGPSD